MFAYKKVGGLHHWSVQAFGFKFGGSLYLSAGKALRGVIVRERTCHDFRAPIVGRAQARSVVIEGRRVFALR